MMINVVIGPPSRKPLCKITSGIVNSVSQMWARNQRCTVPMRQSTIFFRTPRRAAKTKIDDAHRLVGVMGLVARRQWRPGRTNQFALRRDRVAEKSLRIDAFGRVVRTSVDAAR